VARLTPAYDPVLWFGRPCGWVGSRLAGEACSAIGAALDEVRHVAVDVEYRGWTPAGDLRHAVFKGWHEG
jgi:bifunctional non-homologous end joining protein LigD